ncbi:MAG: F0F1 ATP synthase subunit A [Tissierella sp.]|uniref:F0F1 ATP synthase subunit A n=1 Tax=Tissierella sp. TaxID=41274 RepID=UPI003F946104
MELLITIGGNEIIIHDSIINTVLVVIALSILAFYVNKKIKTADVNEKPTGFLNIIEMLVEAVNDLVRTNMGEKNMNFAPYIFTLMCFLGIANLLGLIGLTPPTSDYSVTLTLALITFFATQIMLFKTRRGLGGYLKSFTEPFVLLTPINVIGELANPVSLSFRLFGNVLSGGIIMTLLYGALGYFAPIFTPVMHGYFDIFAGLLQTFIFGMLTMIFIGGATEE